MILFPRPVTTIRLDRGPLQVALRKPPAIFLPSHRTAVAKKGPANLPDLKGDSRDQGQGCERS